MSTIMLLQATLTPSALRVSLWTAQVILFLLFGIVGFLKLTQPVKVLTRTMAWVADAPLGLVRFVGACELAGALGVLLPALTGIAPRLTSAAASGLGMVMVLAIIVHITRREVSGLALPIVLGGLSAFVAWGTYFAAPIA